MDTSTLVKEFNSLIRKAKESERDNIQISLNFYKQAYKLLPNAPNLSKKIESLERKLVKIQAELLKEDWVQIEGNSIDIKTSGGGTSNAPITSSPTIFNDSNTSDGIDDFSIKQEDEDDDDDEQNNNNNNSNNMGEEDLDDFIKVDATSIEDIDTLIDKLKLMDIDVALKLLQQNDFFVIRSMCKHAQQSEDVNYISEIVYFLNGIGNQVEGVFSLLVSELAWIIPNCFMVEETKAAQHLLLLAAIFTQTGPLPATELAKLDETFLDELIDLGFKYLDYYDTKWLNIFYNTLLAYQSQIIVNDGYSPLIHKLYTMQKAPELGPELIALLNRDKFDYGLIGQSLSLVSDIFSYSTEHKVSCFFYSSDIPIIIDILVRNIHNLNELDPLRWQYLDVLYIVLSHEHFQQTQYHVDDIITVLTDMLDEDYAEKDPRTALVSRSILDLIQQQSYQ
ncbi:hypothetical protein PPL_06118 [Heterostelium album PN500]|uniref:SPIN90/Ldb17 leucine-rich domain-containing protein n=1 Tax=Heterostelium pallidum (strain ATCC 26659 / Pp 5 / PN500) TaxID=670386 RepID=D3BC94_HETP5|nr:hypothetical protein PPL_06118 [Heterostelium album PN500]EFA81277.1 hypothetical protein PPL_06118 [Heterostelium album PN500]|eukprot:XP_020433395.1 hypothetical protein PPL_06118 [Heterostelium album PN500]